MGLADVLVPQAEVRAAAQKLAAEIAETAPLGVLATRATMRAGLADRVKAATDTSWRSRRACARPRTSRKASRRWPSAACRISRGGTEICFRSSPRKRGRKSGRWIGPRFRRDERRKSALCCAGAPITVPDMGLDPHQVVLHFLHARNVFGGDMQRLALRALIVRRAVRSSPTRMAPADHHVVLRCARLPYCDIPGRGRDIARAGRELGPSFARRLTRRRPSSTCR